MRVYNVQPGDSPASIAISYAGCPKCSIDLVSVNPHKPTVRYPNGYVTFKDLRAGERLWLPDKWFSGALDDLPSEYFASLPSADGFLADPRPNLPPPQKGPSGPPDYPKPPPLIISPVAPYRPPPLAPVPDPSKQKPPNAGGGGSAGGGTPGETTPSESGMSTGAKVAIGFAVAAAGGFALWTLAK